MELRGRMGGWRGKDIGWLESDGSGLTNYPFSGLVWMRSCVWVEH